MTDNHPLRPNPDERRSAQANKRTLKNLSRDARRKDFFFFDPPGDQDPEQLDPSCVVVDDADPQTSSEQGPQHGDPSDMPDDALSPESSEEDPKLHLTKLIEHVTVQELERTARASLARKSIQSADIDEILQGAFQRLLDNFRVEKSPPGHELAALVKFWRIIVKTSTADHFRHWNRRAEVELHEFHLLRVDDRERADELRSMHRAVAAAYRTEVADRKRLVTMWIRELSRRNQLGHDNVAHGALSAAVTEYNKVHGRRTISVATGFRWIKAFRDKCWKLLNQ